MESYKRLLLNNQAWIKEKLELRPDYFELLAQDQKPEFLWIGCADSRVPAEDITGTEPGELFVHRNVANLAVSTDFNFLSVFQYAVEYLKVKNIIICGHYGCGGVLASMTHKRFGLLNQWLRGLKDLAFQNQGELSRIPEGMERANRLVELNVLEQVKNLSRTSFVQKAWAEHQRPMLHGWVYDLKSGQLKPLIQLQPGAPVDEVYRFDFETENLG